MSSQVDFLTNVDSDCAMRLITQKVVNFIRSSTNKNHTVIDLTWFNQYDSSINNLEGDFVFAVDVADPPYYLPHKIKWMQQLNKPVYYVGPIIKDFPFPIIPFFGWLRFRPQTFKSKIKHEDFFVSFNRKAHAHRKTYFDIFKTYPNILEKGYVSFFQDMKKHEISSIDELNEITKLQSLAQKIDEKQLYSAFEIVCETSAAPNSLFLTEKFNKCVASETPLLFLGDYNMLTTLKKYYGFCPFGPDDSYDSDFNYNLRVAKVLKIADNFFNYPLQEVFDNAKRNANHLFENFDAIHDRYVFKALECIK